MEEMEGHEGGGMHFTAHSAVYSLVVVVFVAFLPFPLRLSLDSNRRRRHELMDRFVKTIDRSIGENALNDPAAV